MLADAVPMLPGLVLLEEPAEPVPLEPLAIAGALGALPVVLPVPALADFSCTWPCAFLQCVAAETLELEPDMPELEEPLDCAETANELPATNAVASNIAVSVFMWNSLGGTPPATAQVIRRRIVPKI